MKDNNMDNFQGMHKTKFDFSDACEFFTDWFGNL